MPITTTPSGGPQGAFNTYTPIYSTTLSSTASTVSFSNIPTTYTDLVLVISAKNPGAGAGFIQMQFNGDTGSSYSQTNLTGDGSTAGSSRATSQTVLKLGIVGNSSQTYTANTFQIMNYSNTTTNKTVLSRTAWEEGAAARVGLWRSTSPITSITLTVDASDANYISGSTFTIYGIKAAVPAPKAAGGDIITTDGTYWYHAFKNTGIFDVKTPVTADILVIAGGGASPAYGTGAGPTGGGGAGGLLYFSSRALSVTTNLVTVGAGGAYTAGNDSQFAALTLVKGGGVGGATDAIGGTGGSGGGSGGRYTSAGGAATSDQGNTGGVGYQQSGLASGGGGGSGASGGGGGNNTGGTGGDGTNAYSAWASATSTGVSGRYAAGGAGMSWYSGSGGAGGAGGGGNGASTSTGTNATSGIAHTGSGGGGSSYGTYGGSGIVIVRYPV